MKKLFNFHDVRAHRSKGFYCFIPTSTFFFNSSHFLSFLINTYNQNSFLFYFFIFQKLTMIMTALKMECLRRIGKYKQEKLKNSRGELLCHGFCHRRFCSELSTQLLVIYKLDTIFNVYVALKC